MDEAYIDFSKFKSISSYIDICEIGLGHNCNTGDGKQIQDSTYRAIKNGIKISSDPKILPISFKNVKNIHHFKRILKKHYLYIYSLEC